MRLIDTLQKEGQLLNSEGSIIVDVNDIEGLSNVIVWEQFSIDVIACGVLIVNIFGGDFTMITVLQLLSHGCRAVALALRTIDLDSVLIVGCEFAVVDYWQVQLSRSRAFYSW